MTSTEQRYYRALRKEWSLPAGLALRYAKDYALKPADIVMYEAGDTAVENVLTACAKIPGKNIIKFSSSNYMVQEICFFLEKCGVKIEGI